MLVPTSSTSTSAASGASFFSCRDLAHSTHHAGSLYAGGALHATLAASGSAFASFVVSGNVFTSSTSTPTALGLAAYCSSAGRCSVTNGSAFSTTTMRHGARNGSVSSSLRAVEKSSFSPA